MTVPAASEHARSPTRTSTSDNSNVDTGTVVARVYIVRHGETEHNRQGIVQGQLDTPLNDTGVEQAQLAADALEDVPFGVAYGSDLKRARKTAEIILEKHPGVPLQTTEALRERFMGDWQGGSIAKRLDPPPNLEPIVDFMARSVKWWNESILRHAQSNASELESKLKHLAAQSDAQAPEPTTTATDISGLELDFEPVHILAVSHGGLIGNLVTNLIGSRKVRAAEGVTISRCFNASISVVELYPDGKGVLLSYADTTHLNGDLVQDNADVR